MAILKTLKKILVDFIFPKDKEEERLEQMSVSDFRDEAEKDFSEHSAINSIFSYRDPLVRKLIWLIKYKKRDYAINLAAQILLDETLEDLSEKISFGGGQKIILIPIPSSRARVRSRGYNQVALIAEEMMRLGGGNYLELNLKSLIKNKETQSQTEIKNRQKRLENVINSFSVLNPDLIKKRTILLLDDVSTTGATLLEARRVLKKAGAKKIICLTLAH